MNKLFTERHGVPKPRIAEVLDDVTRAIGELEVQTLLSGQYDERDALMTIRSEAGGVEAADWAEMLSRMYLRYCERNAYKVDVLETSYAEIYDHFLRISIHNALPYSFTTCF